MASAVGSLKVLLSADMSKFTSDMGRAAGLSERQSRAMARSLGRVTKAVAAVGVAAASAFAVLVRQQINVADQMGKMSQRIGVSVESLSTLGFAAQQTGTNIEALEKGFIRLARNMSDSRRGLETAQEGFRSLGVVTQDAEGNLRKQEDVMLDVAEAMSKLEDGAEKTAIATQVFGRAGAELIPFLNQGADGLRQLQERARELGLEIDTRTAMSAAEFNDKMQQLRLSVVGMANDVMVDAMPALGRITDAMIEAQRESGILVAALVGLGGIFREVFAGPDQASLQGMRKAYAEAAGLVTNLEDQLASRRARARAGHTEGVFEEGLERRIAAARAEMDRLAGSIGEVAQKEEAAHQAYLKGIDDRAEAQRIQTEGLRTRLQAEDDARMAGIRATLEAETAARAVAAAERMRLEGIDAIIAGLERQRETLGKTSRELIVYNLAQLGATQSTIDHALAIYDQIAAHEQLAGTLPKIADAARDTFDKVSTFADQAARNVHTAFADFLFDPFDKGLKGMLKGFIDVVRRMIAEAAALKILGGDGMGKFFSAILGGLGLPTIDGRAAGGPVSGGTPYIVGEKGPELFVPNTSGSIVPNGAGGGVVVNVTVPANVDPRQFVELAREIGRNVMEATETRMNYGYWPA